NSNDSFENSGHTVTAINGTAIGVGASAAVSNGSVTLNADGTLSFAPAANFNGATSFSYTVTSGGVTETAN
ncbi:cadherin-like domain-containing protein, partial [Enterobacteriaceae bacterium H16N7]|nr:cadherin-like domain-containing protein [Dryocola clanedunensis]